MIKRNKEGALTKEETRVVKSLLNKGWRNQDIQALLNIGRITTINSARITEVKANNKTFLASDEEVEFFIKKKRSYDYRTGLNLYDDERLIRAREAMILAVHIFNNPSISFKTEVFAVQANIAWTYLLHEFYKRKGIEIVAKDGNSILLSQMIKRSDCPLSEGIRNNILALKIIRDDVEHKLLKRTDVKFFPLFQACCLNFDKTICSLFGENLSLRNELSLALQFAKLDFEQIQMLQEYDVPEYIKALDIRLDKDLSEEQKNDLEYQFQVNYTLQSASKKGAHIRFIKPESAEGVDIHNVLEKYRSSDETHPYKPKKVCEEVIKRSGKAFTIHNHSQATSLYKVRPKKGVKSPDSTNKKFCIYHAAHQDYTYSEDWVKYLVEAVSNDDEYKKIKSNNLR